MVNTNELYVVGDAQRLVVKNFIQKLSDCGYVVRVIAPIPDRIAYLPETPHHLILFCSDAISAPVIQAIADKKQESGLCLYMVGSLGTIDAEQEAILKRLPSVRFASYSIDVMSLVEEIKANSRKKHLLVVDDEPILLRSAKSWFSDEYDVTLVPSGEMALSYLASHSVDLVLLDYKMPTMDGPTVLERMRLTEGIKSIPVMFLTAKDDRKSVLSVINLKPEGYILKSKSPEEITRTVRDYFATRIVYR